MAGMLDARTAFRLPIIMAGMMLSSDRRVASSWFVAGGVRDDWDRFYDCLISIGRKTQFLALPLVKAVLRKFGPDSNGYLLLAGDDSPTKRYGRMWKGLARITTQLQARPMASGSTGITGSRCA